MRDGRLEEDTFVFNDANGYADNEYPFLVFDRKSGWFVIADDYETSNDIAAREFTITKNGALNLAVALLQYVREGETNTLRSNRSGDVVDRVLKQE